MNEKTGIDAQLYISWLMHSQNRGSYKIEAFDFFLEVFITTARQMLENSTYLYMSDHVAKT